MEEQPCKTPWEELRQRALEHYQEASSAIHHWSSFVEHAILAYQEPKIENDDTNRKDERSL